MAGCTYTLKIRDGETGFERKQYAHALPFFLKDLEKARSRVEKARIAFKIAECYRFMHQPGQALPYYEQAWSGQAGVQALKGKAFSLKMLERYPEAIAAFDQLGEEIGSSYEYRREIEACEWAQKQLDAFRPGLYALESLPFNSRYADFAAFPAKEGHLYFSTDRPGPDVKTRYGWTGHGFSRIVSGRPDQSGIQNGPAPFLPIDMSTPIHEGVIHLASDSTIYFTRCGDGDGGSDRYCRIWTMILKDGTWSSGEVLPFCTGDFNYGHARTSSDGQFLIFSSDDPMGLGGYDLYMAMRTSSGWSDPVMLPPAINTPGNEMFPWWQGDTLYFASDHHKGMGGLDIFRSFRLGLRSWTQPENLGPPFNSGADDFGFIWLPGASQDHLRTGIFTSSRSGGKGGEDIWMIKEKEMPPPVETPSIQPTDTVIALHIYVVTRLYQDPEDPNSPVLGRNQLPDAKVRILPWDTVMTSLIQGPLIVAVEPGEFYRIEAEREGYLSSFQTFDARDISTTGTVSRQLYELEIVLDRKFVGLEIILENIYYDYDRWEIRPDAEPTLRRLASLMEANPDIEVELGSHTDCRGSESYNMDLSQKRAQSAVDYLIGLGIPSGRLRARGFGESRPAVDCPCNRCTESQHQTNRRTTFRILED